MKLDDLIQALHYVSAGDLLGSEAYLCIETGQIHYHTDEFEKDEAPLPDDISNSKKYVAIPHKKELNLGRGLVLRFVDEILPDAFDEVQNMFRRRGAYGRFKDLLQRRGVLEQWYEFEAASQNEALREWCAENGIEFTE